MLTENVENLRQSERELLRDTVIWNTLYLIFFRYVFRFNLWHKLVHIYFTARILQNCTVSD